MYQFTKLQQKILKIMHILVAMLWLSSVIILTVLVYISQDIHNTEALYMYTYIYYFIDMYVLTPAAIMTLITGILYSNYTPWGFAKHRWVIYKWIVTISIILLGTFYLGPLAEKMLLIVETKELLALDDISYISGTNSLFYFGILNLVLLFSATVVAVVKPWKKSK
jgi:hypothetical protein